MDTKKPGCSAPGLIVSGYRISAFHADPLVFIRVVALKAGRVARRIGERFFELVEARILIPRSIRRLDRARTETARLLRRQSFPEYIHGQNLVRPSLHERPPLIEEVGALIGLRGGGAHGVHEAGLTDFRVDAVLCAPGGERRPAAVNRDGLRSGCDTERQKDRGFGDRDALRVPALENVTALALDVFEDRLRLG